MPIKSSNSIGTQKHMIAFKINKSINCVLRLHAHQFYLDSIKITLGPLPLYTSLRTANHAHSAHSSGGWCGRNCTREIHHQWDIDTQSNENSCSIYFFPVNSTTTKIACQIEFEFRALISQRGRMQVERTLLNVETFCKRECYPGYRSNQYHVISQWICGWILISSHSHQYSNDVGNFKNIHFTPRQMNIQENNGQRSPLISTNFDVMFNL